MKKKHEDLINLDMDISFEEAMKHLAVTPASEVDAQMEKNAPKKTKVKTKDRKLLKAPKEQKLLPKPKK
jgi:hypothetical protein